MYEKVAVLVEDFSCAFEISKPRILCFVNFDFRGSAGHLPDAAMRFIIADLHDRSVGMRLGRSASVFKVVKRNSFSPCAS